MKTHPNNKKIIITQNPFRFLRMGRRAAPVCCLVMHCSDSTICFMVPEIIKPGISVDKAIQNSTTKLFLTFDLYKNRLTSISDDFAVRTHM